MAFKPRSAAESKARDLGRAPARIAQDAGTPASIGGDRLRANPRLTPPAIGRTVRRDRHVLEAALGGRGLARIDYADRGPGRGMELSIDAAS